MLKVFYYRNFNIRHFLSNIDHLRKHLRKILNEQKVDRSYIQLRNIY